MRFYAYIIIFAASTTLLSGCSITPTTANASITAAADYGAYPDNYEALVKSHFHGILKDPYSAQYRFSKPYKAYLRSAPIAGGHPTIYGYIVDTRINAKNSYGGYTGEKLYRVFIRDWAVVELVQTNPWFSEPWYRD